jgi:2-aminoethylphosphonate-pyruvate transaminase
MNAASRLLKLRRTEFLNKLSLRKSSSSTKKLLFTPGPLLTSKKVKQSMMVDLGSRDIEFINVVKFIQTELLDVAGVGKPNQDYVTVLMQGSGTFGVESVIQTVTKRDRSSNFLILENGAYGKRMGTICKMLDVPHHIESYPEHRAIDLQKLEEFMKKGTKYTHVV